MDEESGFCGRKHIPEGTPEIVCLCGSTRFWKMFQEQGLKLTLEGKIVLSIGVASPDSMVLANPSTDEGRYQKDELDRLHKRKIDLSDRVLVLNVDGYIGASAAGEVAHAYFAGKPITWLEKPDFREMFEAVKRLELAKEVWLAFYYLLEDQKRSGKWWPWG